MNSKPIEGITFFLRLNMYTREIHATGNVYETISHTEASLKFILYLCATYCMKEPYENKPSMQNVH